MFLQHTDTRFNFQGDRTPWLGNGVADSRGLFTDLIVGLHDRVDLWVQAPFFDLQFTDAVNARRTTGFGDIRAWVRWNPVNLGGSTPISFRLGAKAPIGSSPLDAEIIPVGEGQWDVEAFGEVGHSFWPFPAYAQVWLGYRARFENTEKAKDPGGEYVFLAEAGGNPTGWSFVKATVDGFIGRKWVVEGFRTNTSREIVTVQLGGALRIRAIWPEVGVRIPLRGQEFPAGVQYVIGFSTQVR